MRLKMREVAGCLAMGIIVVLFSGGCALTTDYANIAYHSQGGASRIPQAGEVSVKIKVSDSRGQKDKVSAKINGFGTEMAAILTKQDVAILLSDAVSEELRNRRFRISGGGVLVKIELKKFYNQFKAGMWSGTSTAQLDMGVSVKNNGSVIFNKDISAETTRSIAMATGANAAITLNTVFKKAVAELMDDRSFIAALLKCATPKKINNTQKASGKRGGIF